MAESLRPKNRCLICLGKIKTGKYCPSCRQKIKENFNKRVKQAWSQSVQDVYTETALHPSAKALLRKK